ELAVKLHILVAQHRARQQTALEQNLKPVADTKDGAAFGGKLHDRFHDWREPRDRAGAQVIAVREPAGQDDEIRAAERRVLVPDEWRIQPQHVLGRVIGVVIAVGSWKNDDRNFHGFAPGASSIRKLSMTGLASTRSATSDASFSASPVEGTLRSSSKYLP